MSTIVSDPTADIAQRIATERETRDWSLAELAERSGVSKAMLSKIEREEASPTAVILCRISTAFGLTLAELLTNQAAQPPTRLLRAKDQPQWRDPRSHYIRRQVFISQQSPMELVEVELPANTAVALPKSSYEKIAQVVWLIAGRLTIAEGKTRHDLKAGDRLEFGPPADTTFANDSAQSCRYLVALIRK